jgi:hypothetical protein
LPLRIGAASTKLYIERGAYWCGQGKNNSFFEGCGTSTCPYGTLFPFLFSLSNALTQASFLTHFISNATTLSAISLVKCWHRENRSTETTTQCLHYPTTGPYFHFRCSPLPTACQWWWCSKRGYPCRRCCCCLKNARVGRHQVGGLLLVGIKGRDDLKNV